MEAREKSDGLIVVFDTFLSFLLSLAFVRVFTGVAKSQVAHLHVYAPVSYVCSLFAIDRSFR